MKEGFNTILSPIEQAWTIAKVDMNSNYFKEFGKNSNMNMVRTLYDYYKAHEFTDGKRHDSDLKDSDKTKNYFVITIDDPTGRSENGTIDLIVDATGHDVAITYLGEDGQKFEISPDIIKNNAEMLGMLDFAVDMNPTDIAKMIAPKDMEELVREIEKNDTVAMRSKDDAKNRADDYDKKEGSQIRLEAEKDAEARDAEIDEELKENSDIPEEMYGEIYKICIENDLNPSDLKQSLTIVDPKEVMSQIDNTHTQVRENGGEVTVLRFRNKEMGTSADKIFMVQNGEMLKSDEGNDQKMTELMEEHKGNGVKVENFEDTRLVELEARLENLLQEYNEKKEQIDQNFDNVELTDKFTEEKRETAREEAISELKVSYSAEVESICNEYQPPKSAEVAHTEQSAKAALSGEEKDGKEESEPEQKEQENEEDRDERDPIFKLLNKDTHNH